MKAEAYLKKYKSIYDARDTRRKFIPLEKISNDPVRYGYKWLLDQLPEGYKSNAKQEAFINSKQKITASICANRGGKSEALAIKAIKTLESIKVDRGGAYWVITESYDLQRDGIQTKINLYFKPERIDQESISYVKKGCFAGFDYINKHGIRIPVRFKTYEQGESKLQAAKLYGASFDEEPPEKVFDEVYTRTIDLNGKIDMAYTPLKGLTWSYKRIFCDPDVLSLNWGMADNPFIPRDEITKALSTWTKRKVMMRIYGQYQGAEGIVFDSFDRDANVKPNLYDERFPVSVCVDWGVRVVCIQFFQERTITSQLGTVKKENYMVAAVELAGAGYGHVMKYILSRGYYIPPNEYFCDPAGSARSQATKTGTSLLRNIEKDYGIKFRYIKKLGIEESIEIVNAWFMNAEGKPRIFIQEGITLNEAGDTPEMRIENYVRDDETKQPVKDNINDHFCDSFRYYCANKNREETGGRYIQH
jgi:phage terminase large subunit-like protein